MYLLMFLFRISFRFVEKVSNDQITSNSTRLFILKTNHSNVIHAKGPSTKRFASESISLAENTKSNRKSYRILLLNKVKLKTRLNALENDPLVNKNRLALIVRLIHKNVVKVVAGMMLLQPVQTVAMAQTMLIWLRQLTLVRMKALCFPAVIRRPHLFDRHQS